MKQSIRRNQTQHLLATAKNELYSNLYINYENLEEIPREVLEINSIQGLFLKRNLLKTLPADLWRLTFLKTLYLPSNKLTSLPDEIGKCEHLENLNVDDNFLKSLPKTIGELRKLQKLQASNNELEVIPPEIGQLKSLEVLELMKNSIKYLPNELSGCSRLRSLFVGSNKVEEIPADLLKLSSLEDLSLNLERLSQLKSLVMDSNQDLIVFPAAVLQISNLQTLGMQGCGSKHFGKSNQEILEHYLKLQGMKNIVGNVLPLLELCLRKAPQMKHELLPKMLQTFLETPKGHCYFCKQRYYLNAFFQLCNSLETQLVTLMEDKLFCQIDKTNCCFVFCFCSYNCFESTFYMN
ncbi:plant intracellular Ras-group-related LRR protein 7-like isoform X2 [Dendronephthya gigantea]|uniref:plant intracellular Ras-group-related LRR protein 7-like isoform X2 n=1 Tax=Dendronephthya gigantea TaxID=151771 RepID=UPI001069C8DD|nr:plant intracellular Ras-group-related LRR protein 7-like isoform X2 [Dendronephthya gigantea]